MTHTMTTCSHPLRRYSLRIYTLLAIVTFSLLAGCAVSPPTPSIARQHGMWKQQQGRLERLQQWEINGKIGFRSPQQSRSANLDWTQNRQHYLIMVSGPFGVGRNTLVGQPGNVSLQNSNGTFNAPTAEDLMEQQLGWSLPVSALNSWIKGEATPDSPSHFTHDRLGFPQTLQQNGWTIHYEQWSYAGTYWLPGRLKLTYGDITVIFVITQWQPNHTSS